MTFRYCVMLGVVSTAIVSNNALAQIPTSVEFKVGVETANTKRNVSLSDAVVDRTSSSIKGLEAELTAVGGGADFAATIAASIVAGIQSTASAGY